MKSLGEFRRRTPTGLTCIQASKCEARRYSRKRKQCNERNERVILKSNGYYEGPVVQIYSENEERLVEEKNLSGHCLVRGLRA